jgi:hypothetical protein
MKEDGEMATKMESNGMSTPPRGKGTPGTAGTQGTPATQGTQAAKGKAAGSANGSSRARAATTESGAGSRARRVAPAKDNGSDLKSDLREFAKGRPHGWNHDEWLGFIEHLRGKGHNINDQEAIGSMLERERIGVLLEKVPGLGAQRIRSLSEAFGNVWRLREADVDQIARTAKLPRDVAQRVVDTLHQ